MARLLFTARSGGVSTLDYESLNLGDHVGDDSDLVAENRNSLQKLVSASEIQFMDQVHGDVVSRINETSTFAPKADALITSKKDLALVVMVADCLPILVSGQNVAAAIHVGRRGMANGVIKKTIAEIRNISDERLIAHIGPGICENCYEVDEATYKELVEKYPGSDAGYRKLNLRAESTKQLEEMGVRVVNINICTMENEKYYSYRRDGKTGRQAGAIIL